MGRRAITVMSVLAVLFCTACTIDETDLANDLIDKSNKHMGKLKSLTEKSSDTWSELDNLDTEPEDGEAWTRLTGDLGDLADEQIAEVKKAAAAVDEIGSLDVSAELHEYAGLVGRSLDVWLRAAELEARVTTQWRELAEKIAAGSLSDENWDAFWDRMEPELDKLGKLEDKASSLEDEAENYYVDMIM